MYVNRIQHSIHLPSTRLAAIKINVYGNIKLCAEACSTLYKNIAVYIQIYIIYAERLAQNNNIVYFIACKINWIMSVLKTDL